VQRGYTSSAEGLENLIKFLLVVESYKEKMPYIQRISISSNQTWKEYKDYLLIRVTRKSKPKEYKKKG